MELVQINPAELCQTGQIVLLYLSSLCSQAFWMVDRLATATIRLTNDEEDTHEVPADVLVRALAGMQQLVYVIATAQEQRTIKDRFRLSQEIQQRYSLTCKLPQTGSYAMPIALGAGQEGVSLFTNYLELLSKAECFLNAIHQGNVDRLVDLIPDGKLRNRGLRAVRKLLPKPGEGWRFGFQQLDHREVLLSSDTAIATIDRELAQVSSEDTVMTVTGELIRIDFDKRTVVLRYPPTHTEIECVYVDELEETMIENRRGLIQATGEFTLDQEGNPTKLSNVTQLQPVDLSPIHLKAVQWNDRMFRFRDSLVLHPKLDEESSQLYVVEDPALTLIAYAQTREQLLQEISEQVAFMWDAYVSADDEALAEDALTLKRRLSEFGKEVLKDVA